MNKLAPQAVPAHLTESKRTNLARELFTGNLWMCSLTMLKYIPRSFREKQVDRTHVKSILISPPDVAIDHLFPPYTKEKVQALNQWFDY